MRYYNEVKKEQTIRRKARIFTFVTMFILVSGIYFTTSGMATDLWENEIKEWIKEEVNDKEAPTKKAKQKKSKNRA